MRSKIILVVIVVSSIALTASIVNAAGMSFEWLRIGAQDVGGVTFFNGTVVNETTDSDGNDNPVVFGDNVRIDGRVWRGATAGTSDTMPFIVNDNMEVAGDLTVTGGIVYNNASSGLTAATVQDAIDELGSTTSNAISGGSIVGATADFNSAISATTWKGNAFGINGSGTSGAFFTTTEVTVVFTPTSATVGTFTSTPFNAFVVGINDGTNVCEVGLAGSYRIVGDDKLYVYGWDNEGTICATEAVMQITLKGNQLDMYQIHNPKTYITHLERQ